MTSTNASRRDVFRTIATTSYSEWPAYDSTPLYDRSSLRALEEDIRTVANGWFDHDAHESADDFVCHVPLTYIEFQPHDRYTGAPRYEMCQLFRTFLLKELHGWDHETALVEYLQQRPSLRCRLGFNTAPDQSTLWRSWHYRFAAELRETVKTTARTILIQADRAGVSTPREPRDGFTCSTEQAKSAPNDQAVLDRTEEVTNQVSRIVYPAFSLNRGDGCKIHENAFWDLQTYLGLRESVAANEGARSFVYESRRERTPLGHTHREHLRDFIGISRLVHIL